MTKPTFQFQAHMKLKSEFNQRFTWMLHLLFSEDTQTYAITGSALLKATCVCEIIAEGGFDKRKLYAGGIGYFTPNNEFDTCIALRTALIKNNKFYVQAGAGIVADSLPHQEYDETVNKAKALMKAVD